MKIPYFIEVSAKTGFNVHQIFHQLMNDALKYKREVAFYSDYDVVNKLRTEAMMKEEDESQLSFLDKLLCVIM